MNKTQTSRGWNPGALGAALLGRAIKFDGRELPALLWAFAYFFCLLCSYYILRPLRDEMGIVGGVDQLQWLFTGTFLAMLGAVPLFGWVAARFPRRTFLPVVYAFFALNILIFFVLFKAEVGQVAMARAFFVWTSVFNLFVVSVFWSFMADLFSNEQARRLFGFIAAGGSAGAVTGPALTALLASPLGAVNLLLLSVLFLGIALLCVTRLNNLSINSVAGGSPAHSSEANNRPDTTPAQLSRTGIDEKCGPSDHAEPPGREEQPMGGGAFAGVKLFFTSPYLLGIGLFIWLFTTLSTFLYFEQAHIMADAFDSSEERTAVFATIDFAVNLLTILVQLFVTGRLVERLGLTTCLTLIPVAVTLGFLSLGLAPILPVLLAFQILRRAGNYAITRPAREMLFTVVGREEKYKAKNFVDTVIYRGGDAVSGWVFAGLKAVGLSLSAIAFIAVPIGVLWIATAVLLGRKQEKLRLGIFKPKTDS